MIRAGLRSASELAKAKPHGTRIKYLGGCKCLLCRAANANYQKQRDAAKRRGESNGLIDASEVRRHLLDLSDRGIGRDTIADIVGVCVTSVELWRSGKRKNIRALTARKILAISQKALLTDAQLIPAKKTWTLINWMLGEGFTKGEIARRLGYKTRALQLNRRVITARNAQKVEQLYNRLRLGEEEEDAL